MEASNDHKEKKSKSKKEKKEKKQVEEEVVDESKKRKIVEEVAEPDTEELDDELKQQLKKEKKAKKQAKRDKLDEETKKQLAVADIVTSHQMPAVQACKKSTGSTNHYVIHREVLAMTSDDIASYRASIGIQVFPETDAALFAPLTSFEHLGPSLDSYCPHVQAYVQLKNFTKPSPIQSQCWPALLSGKDVVGIADTGSGKTLAFLVPAMLRLAQAGSPGYSAKPSPRVLVMAPTRELAMQSHQVIVEINGPKGVCIYGGVPKPPQIRELRAGADIVVATPGRLLDLVEEGALSLAGVMYAVLDEADRMLDEGFEPEIRKILAACKPPGDDERTCRQTVMFSATWPDSIRQLADRYFRPTYTRVTVGSDELSANHRVTQIVEVLDPAGHAKDKRLFHLLEKYHKSRTNRCLIFVLYKKEAVTLQQTLLNKGYKVTAIHGDRCQNDRTAALDEFKRGTTPLLIATDVAARGLDIPQVEYVLNYTFPLTVEDYVHRIGRTGRGGATGISHTFFTDNEKALAGALVAVLEEAGQVVPQEIYKYPLIMKKKTSKLYGDFGPKADLQGKQATKITFDD